MIRKMLETDTVLKRCKIIATGIAKDYHRSQDIMQQAFLVLLQNAKKYDDIECPEDFYRLFWKLCKREHDRLIYRLDQQVAYEDLTAVDHVSGIETDDMINALPEKLRSVARYLLDSYTVREIASKLSMSTKTVIQHKNTLKSLLTVAYRKGIET